MFGLSAAPSASATSVGPRQTHGVGLDFARRLLQAIAAGEQPLALRVLGDGSQSKSYIHVEDVVRAVVLAQEKTPRASRPTTSRPAITLRCARSPSWRRVPRAWRRAACGSTSRAATAAGRATFRSVRLNTDRIKTLGWRCQRPSREALRQSILAMIPELQAGRL
jgi:UDP-glucose 4-epimerase